MVKPEQLKDLLHAARLPRREALTLILASQSERPVKAIDLVKIGRDNGIHKIATWNVSRYLAQNNNGRFVRLPEGWALGPKGKTEAAALVAKLGGGPLIVINQSLRALLPKLPEGCRSFVAEAIADYETKCYRSAVVLSWIGAVAILHDHIVQCHLVALNAEALARDPNWKAAKTADDLGLMKEDKFLDILVKIGVLGKNVKENLKNQCLALRNGCGHPNSLEPGENMVAAHLESLINHVYTKF